MSDASLAATRSQYHPLVDLTQHIAQTRKIHEKSSEGAEFHQRRLAIYDRTCATLDVAAFAQLQDKHRHELADFNPSGHLKYFDLPYWIWHKTALAVELGLDRKIAGTILDLGVGAGHFPAICQAYGHKVVGIDIANDQYDDLCAYFRVERITQRILPGRVPGCGVAPSPVRAQRRP